tara:strand:+ start:6605 stop:7903 length:1299 start_codon:yes stop_codon:yes gene_type:complete
MPSVSKSQQRLMGMAYAVKDGSLELSDIDPAYRDKVKSLSDGMTKKDLKKYASTKHDDLPETVDETIQQTAITPNTIGGMGEVSLPANGELGSGDFPHTIVQVADIDDDEEAKKQKGTVKNLQAEELALTFQAFLNEQNEAMDYNDPVLIRLRQDKLRRADMAKLDAIKKEAEKNRKKAMKRWNTKSYEKWLEDVASNGGAENAFDMARNAEFEPGLIDWIKKEFPMDEPMQRLQWDIEAFAESVVTEGKYEDMLDQGDGHVHFIVKDEATAEKLADAIEAKGLGDCDFYPEDGKIYLRVSFSVGYSGKEVSNLKKVEKLVGMKAQAGSPEIWAADESTVNEKKLDRDDMMKWIEKYMDFVKTTEEFNGSEGGIWVSGENGDEYKGRVIYAYYSEDYKNRTFGVDNRWEKELNKRGWYSEWHDAGTSMIWPL